MPVLAINYEAYSTQIGGSNPGPLEVVTSTTPIEITLILQTTGDVYIGHQSSLSASNGFQLPINQPVTIRTIVGDKLYFYSDEPTDQVVSILKQSWPVEPLMQSSTGPGGISISSPYPGRFY